MRFRPRLILLWALLCLVTCPFVGCNKGADTTAVEGVVTLDGKPLEGASVLFEPEAGARPAVGLTDAAGKFTLTAYVGSNGVAVAKGLDLGAGVAAAEEEGDAGSDEEGDAGSDEEGGDPSVLEDDGSGEDFAEDINELETPPKYASALTSGITVDVQRDMPPVTLELISGK